MTHSPEFDRVPQGVSPAQPHSARIYDYLLGGKDNYEADRVVAQRMLAIDPDTRTLAWFSRQFLLHATQLAAKAGVQQFLDLGCGIPTDPSVPEVARRICPEARVVGVDYDPVVVAHSKALLPDEETLLMDVRDPEAVIDHVRSEELIDFDRPVAVLMVGLLHFVMDDEHPRDIIVRFRKRMASGSYLALTHATTDDTDPRFLQQTTTDTRGSPAQVQYRSTEAVRDLIGDGFDVLGPGIVPLQSWLGGDLPATNLVILAAVCRTR
ncbi:SAM-dependent methyltransferase [Nocardia sp. NPDC003482]